MDYVAIKSLSHLAYRLKCSQGDLCELVKNLDSHYQFFSVPKKNGHGERIICKVSDKLKIVQRKILNILNTIRLHNAAHGGVKGRSSKSYAEIHSGQRIKYCLDLKDCYPSIHSSKIRRMFEFQLHCSPVVSKILTKLTSYKHELPQGLPTSMAILNIICKKLDEQLQRVADVHKLKYTRYVDDLTFSGDYLSDKTKEKIKCVITRKGFIINEKKECTYDGKCPSIITGLNVDGKIPVVPRIIKRNLRARKYNNGKILNKDGGKESRSINGIEQYIKYIEGLPVGVKK